MNVEELKTKTEADISEFITKKIVELKKKTGKEVSDIQFTAREKMTGLESYDIKIKLI
ncbi:GnsA/GnsB family addiction module toxin [Citrobacter braakii]|uniref:GnsA/GnsB family addiction module toxin n=1 Tax=Citrobacter braakii TaxID=57706 RepID=UPI00308025E9